MFQKANCKVLYLFPGISMSHALTSNNFHTVKRMRESSENIRTKCIRARTHIILYVYSNKSFHENSIKCIIIQVEEYLKIYIKDIENCVLLLLFDSLSVFQFRIEFNLISFPYSMYERSSHSIYHS
jgi:hypothetical protein